MTLRRAVGGRSFSPSVLRHLAPAIHQQFAEVFAKYRELTAVTILEHGRETSKTYDEFEQDLRVCAGTLSNLSPTAVAVCVGGNTYQNLLNIISALLSGHSVLPLGSHLPDTAVKRYLDRLEQNGLASRLLQDHQTVAARSYDGPWRPFADPRRAVLIPSSGTTGEPKIVSQGEDAILANCDALIARHGWNQPGVRVATPLPIYHVNALEFSTLCSLMSGQSLCLLQKFDILLLKSALVKHKVDVLSVVPPLIVSMLKVMERFPWPEIQLKYVVSAAAPLASATSAEFRRRSGRRIVQGYGMSEAVNFSALMPIDLGDGEYATLTENAEFPSIGTSLECNEIEILRPDGVPTREGERGELCLAGWNLMSGYLGRGLGADEITADGWLKTGDLGYFRSVAGRRFFFISGRIKETIKKAGASISMREIDEFLALRPGAECDMISVPVVDPIQGENFAIHTERELSHSERESVKSQLKSHFGPEYVPSEILFPGRPLRTPSGKALRRKF